ncbi:MAG: hypothetical protein OEY09_10425 [Gammaproteobacteria bacterium]|nr:hypothetical protein [Gammaproteobacteria bacterium]
MATQYDKADQGRLTEFEGHTETLDIAVTANQPKEVLLQGRFIYVDDDTDGKVYIRFNDKHSHRFPIQAGAVYKNIIFKRVFLDWEAQPGKKINIVYGQDANFAPTNDINNIGQVGSIASITQLDKLLAMPDDYYHRPNNQRHFIGSDRNTTPAASPRLQIWNPAGSGVSLAVKALHVAMAAIGSAYLASHNAAYTSVDPSTMYGNKYLAGPSSKGVLWQDEGAFITSDLRERRIPVADTYFSMIDGEPIIVPEGQGLVTYVSGIIGTRVVYEWEEFAP